MRIQFSLAVLLLSSICLAQQATIESAEVTDNAARHAAARKTASSIEAVMDVDGETIDLKLRPEPLLSFQAVIRRWSNGSAWIWQTEGRPQAMMCLSTLNGSRQRFYECLSFSRHTLNLKEPGGMVWTPDPAWSPKGIDDTKPPVGSRRLRLAQMRRIAARFTAYQRDFFAEPNKGERHEMRLLSQPIYRYDSESDESLDGAFFAFVRNGDLELLLVIEAEKTAEGKAKWVYSPYEVTVHELNLMLDEKPVWHLENKGTGDVQNPKERFFLRIRNATDEEISGVVE